MPFRVGDSDLSITASVGAALADGSPAEHVWRNAETALARAKAAGGGQVELFAADGGTGAAGPAETPLEPGETRGVDGAFIWRVDVDEAPAAASTAGQLMRVRVTVADRAGGAERARLSSLRLGEGG